MEEEETTVALAVERLEVRALNAGLDIRGFGKVDNRAAPNSPARARQRTNSRTPHRPEVVQAEPSIDRLSMARLSFDDDMTGTQAPEAVSILRCRMCSDSPFDARDSRGLLQHMVRAHLGQSLPATAIEQLRHLNKGMCCVCGGIRSCTVPHCAHCGMATPIRDPRVGDTIPDRRRGAHHTPTVITDGSNQQAGDGAAHLEALPDDADGVDQTQVSIRRVTCPRGFEVEAEKLRQPPLIQVPLSVAARFAATWTDSLEGCMAGDRLGSSCSLQVQIAIGSDPVRKRSRR